MKWAVVLLAVGMVAAAACGSSGDAPTGSPTPAPGAVVMEVTVGPMLEDCFGPFPMRCMVVDDELFYAPIDGFDYREGYDYVLRIEQYDAWPGLDEPPQDAGRYGYRLLEVVSKTPAR